MSEAAFQTYEEAVKQQLNRNEARRIRTRVTEARRNPYPASIRWPFELLQNALDAGPRNGRSSVTIRLCHERSKVVFEHDGAPFTSIELAALLSGGSSKEFDSDVTTGRFGTGFLVTHVLAESTNLRGLLELKNSYERFDLILDRGGDEDAILENIRSCDNAIRAAEPVADFSEYPSARFEYPILDDSMLTHGLNALKQALPYLYATRQKLGRLEINTEAHGKEVWTAGEIHREPFENGYVEHRSIHIESNGCALPEMCVFRFTIGQDSAALALVERTAGEWRVRLPEPHAPRVYREYPLRGSGFLPINFVLDGKFEPEQERNGLLMGLEDKQLLQNSFAASALAVKYAFQQKWEGSYLLAQVSKPMTAFNPSDDEEKQWWIEQLATFAKCLAVLPIVECTSEFLPAIASEGATADFIIPRLLVNSAEDETTVMRLWPLIEAADVLIPPRRV